MTSWAALSRQFTGECLVEDGLLEFAEGGELLVVEGFEFLNAVR